MQNYDDIPKLNFRKFLTSREVEDYAGALSAAYPCLCKRGSIGRSREGREITLLTITDFSTGAPGDKPAYLVHGNIHAAELSGTHAALYTAGRLLADKKAGNLLGDMVFYIIPRVNPDGAEYVVATSGPVRSRTDRENPQPNTLYPEDMDGDGLILSMRQEHPDGEYAAHPREKRLLVRRRAASRGPFYRLLPEGRIHDWDGGDDIYCDGRSFDWNRNWSYDWRPEFEQPGAGDFPFSEPEMRCLAEFIHGRDNLFGILGYHTGPAAVLRPPSTGTDDDLDDQDLRVMEDLAKLGSESSGFPVIPVVRYHNVRERDCNLRGHFHDFGYHHLGLFVFEFELGRIIDSSGIGTEEQFAAENEEEKARQLIKLLKWWDEREEGENMLFRNWTKFDHPQLGEVEAGGFLRSVFSNPDVSQLKKISEGTYKFTVEHASRHPMLVLEDVAAERVEGNIYRIRARVANRGEFPSNVSNKGETLRRMKPVKAAFYPPERGRLLSSRGHHVLGHLEGVTGARLLEWFVSASASASEKNICRIKVTGGAGGNIYRSVRLRRDSPSA